jgi:hypothetical protein
MRSVVFASLLDDGITNIDAFAPALPPSSILPSTLAEPHSSLDIADVPRVHGRTLVDTEEEESSTPSRVACENVDVPHVHGDTEPTQISKSIDDVISDDENQLSGTVNKMFHFWINSITKEVKPL